MSAFYRIVRWITYPIVFIAFRTKVKGKQNIPKSGGFLLCCNHVSMIDIPILIMIFGRQIHFMGKEELFKNKPLAWLFKNMGSFAVKRGKGDTGAIQISEDIVKSGKVLGIFPEGTRSKDGNLQRAKSGAALIASSTGAPILPVAIHYPQKIRPFTFGRVTVNIGKLIPPEEFHITETTTTELRRASAVIMGAITKLWEEQL